MLGYRKRKNKSWIRPESWKGFKERKRFKQTLACSMPERLRERLQQEYRKEDLEVKKCLKKDKREWAKYIAQEAEDAARCGKIKYVYDATRRQCSE